MAHSTPQGILDDVAMVSWNQLWILNIGLFKVLFLLESNWFIELIFCIFAVVK